MAKKTEMISAINSYATARSTGDVNLVNLSVHMLEQLLDTIEFEPEDEPELVE